MFKVRFSILFLVLSMSVGLKAEKQPFDRYQPILDRQMFGQVPEGFDPTKPPSEVAKSSGSAQRELTKEQEQLKSSIHFSVINVTPDGETAVGFTDNSDPKAPVHYYLKVGEKRNGWEVQEADPQKATMTIAKGDIVVSLELGANSAKTAGATTAAKAAPTTVSSSGRTSFSTAARPSAFSALGGGGGRAPRFGGRGGLKERRELLRSEQKAQAEAAAAKQKAEADRRAAEAAEKEAARQEELQTMRDELQAQREEIERTREEAKKAREESERREQETLQGGAEKEDHAENDA